MIITHYNASYGCGKCLKQAFFSSLVLHPHKKVCLGLTTRKAARVSDGKRSSGGGDSSHGSSSKATPKKEGKAATTNSQGSDATPESQPSPCHSRWGTSQHHKSHKRGSAGHKAHKDGGHH